MFSLGHGACICCTALRLFLLTAFRGILFFDLCRCFCPKRCVGGVLFFDILVGVGQRRHSCRGGAAAVVRDGGCFIFIFVLLLGYYLDGVGRRQRLHGVVAGNIYTFLVLLLLYVSCSSCRRGLEKVLVCGGSCSPRVVADGEGSKQHGCAGEASMGGLSGFASTNALQVVVCTVTTCTTTTTTTVLQDY